MNTDVKGGISTNSREVGHRLALDEFKWFTQSCFSLTESQREAMVNEAEQITADRIRRPNSVKRHE